MTNNNASPPIEDSHIDAERCIAELQRGRPIVLSAEADGVPSYQVIQLIETISATELEQLIAARSCHLLISRPRALALDLHIDRDGVFLELHPQTAAQTVFNWAGLLPETAGAGSLSADCPANEKLPQPNIDTRVPDIPAQLQSETAKAALNLSRFAHVLPAFITYNTPAIPANVLSVSVNEAKTYDDNSGNLIMLSSAPVPLAAAENTRLTVFRERHGNAEHVAITVGNPDLSGVVTVRLHSSCFTGDILGSMKCDCGEQLDRAIAHMADGDGGVVIYVSQEGRGIGLPSKLLAYQLQDQGLDTIDANQHLGFGADERQYSAAVCMLEKLGINNVRLMTNNPLKIEALQQHGVNVHGRVPSPATVNVHNARYLETKRNRAGHLATCKSAGSP